VITSTVSSGIPAAAGSDQSLAAGDPATAYAACSQAAEIGDRFRDPDLKSFAGMARGLALIRLGETTQGVASIDEAMVAVTAGEVTAMIAGIVYCGVIGACQGDIRSAASAGVDRGR
jgi:hypothetical protein